MLGEFEYLIIAAAVRLGDDAYGAAVQSEIEQTTGRSCSAGALYTTLDRLERKALIRTRMGNPTPERGGRAKRMIEVTASGVREAKEFHRTVIHASSGLPWSASKAGSRS
jgi:DNA-binding PadR family transcriptional regulator